MFDSRFVWTGVAVAAIASFALVFSKAPENPEITPIAEPVSGIERQEQPPAPEYAYIIKEYDGRIAVFRSNAKEPEFVLDVLVKYLPDFDRSQMRDGIPVKDYSQLVSLIEDYVS